MSWAIRDEATGLWLRHSRDDWGPNDEKVARYPSYSQAAGALWNAFDMRLKWFRDTARIVPTPPREMTDEECWVWFKRQNGTTRISWAISTFALSQVEDTDLGTGRLVDYGHGATPCDAIRAARRKLEGGK